MSPFDFQHYRAFLEKLCADRGASRGFRANLARAAGCQASYFSQALRGKAHLTEDHLIGIAAHLSLSPDETEFLLLLLRRDKAGTEKLRAFLTDAVEKNRKAHAGLKNRVKAKEAKLSERDLGSYAASWVPSCVHLLTSDPDHQTPDAIAKRLSLPLTRVNETLHFLEKAGFVTRSGKSWHYKPGSLHISRDSPWHGSLQSTRRELAARSIALHRDEDVHFSSLFTIDPEHLGELRALATKLIESSHKIISASGTKQLACICLNVFEVV